MGRRERVVDVLVVGAGPAGLSAAARLAAAGAVRVEVLEREPVAGGVPVHCDHPGFGLRARGLRPVTGPEYARRLAGAAVRAGASLRTGVTATGWAGPRVLDTTGPGGLERITARAVVLATGARDRPRAARLVPGTRPAGVLTAGELQRAVYGYGRQVGRRAVVAGGGPVAAHAVAALRRAGAVVAALATGEPGPGPRTAGAGAPVLAGAVVTELLGRGRLSGVRLRHPDGRETLVRCDTVVFTGDWIPDHELARTAGAALDPATRGPAVDGSFRTSLPGVFAAGNALRGIERAAVAAAEGRAVAGAVLARLAGAAPPWPAGGTPPVRVAAPFRWVVPNRLGGTPGRFLLRPDRPLTDPVVVARQDGRTLARWSPRGTFGPHRSLALPGGWADAADPAGGPVLLAAD
ncbi:NAD(P)/FAD-dependent oxidoreductase [Streptomyces sp. LP05-1]|uniref:NAD(P)/FAD-dependent oxidoreductase n=1 Tax=Streptomyces pyxinae TaxID=2970734 RepID=A0ABT2CHE8_9ACTN|nr:NAD(P)/FAD-dependent oxidoreductase [Streptomyces sp. LP05-1]MCS0636836.1 NAD(P)/FAD-dependent oxidoreductase [Streptomyces sp. LP05-1]